MQLPLQITLHGLEHSDALEQAIRSKAAKLEQIHSGIISCRVVVEPAGRHRHQGNAIAVRVDLKLPGHEIAVTHHQHEDVYVALRNAFISTRRELRAHARTWHGQPGIRHARSAASEPSEAADS